MSRFAVYFAPAPDTPLSRFGRDWFGRDAPHLETPRRYGLHATLKAPFRLRAGLRREQLEAAMASFAGARRPSDRLLLRPGVLSGFLALLPDRANPGPTSLARDCVVRFDPFRAPPGKNEPARRMASGSLDRRQRELLERWGYPHVMDRFRFHLTLTDRIAPDLLARERAIAEAMLREAGVGPLVVDAISLFEEPGPDDRFREIARFPLGGSEQSKMLPGSGA